MTENGEIEYTKKSKKKDKKKKDSESKSKKSERKKESKSEISIKEDKQKTVDNCSNSSLEHENASDYIENSTLIPKTNNLEVLVDDRETVLINSTFISLTNQIMALTEQRNAIMPFVDPGIATLVLKKKKKSLFSSSGVPKKRKITAYLAFFKDIKKTDPKISMKDAGVKWNSLNERDRIKYQDIAEKENFDNL